MGLQGLEGSDILGFRIDGIQGSHRAQGLELVCLYLYLHLHTHILTYIIHIFQQLRMTAITRMSFAIHEYLYVYMHAFTRTTGRKNNGKHLEGFMRLASEMSRVQKTGSLFECCGKVYVGNMRITWRFGLQSGLRD